MQKVQWQKKSSDGVVLGNLEIQVPTVDEISALKRTGEGWCFMSLLVLAIRSAKVDAATKFMSMLKNGASRADAEKRLRESYVPGVVYEVDVQATIDKVKRTQAIESAESLKGMGIGVEIIEQMLLKSMCQAEVDSVLMAVGLKEDEAFDEEEEAEAEE